MPSTLTWLDHDPTARERALRILALFQERESRDELGLGSIRDSVSDLLFPGTSTLQTRLRYMLFVPWIYLALEERRLPPERFAANADRVERELISPLVASADSAGVFGRAAGDRLKRLPSSVYWAGLGAWGIRLTPYSQGEYHRRIAETYELRRAFEIRAAHGKKRGDDTDRELPPGILDNWHPRLPKQPASFPGEANLALTREEAEFILDRIEVNCQGSLLAHLALHNAPAEISAPWEHPEYASFSEAHKDLLENARLFSELMHGAALSYNYQLAQLGQRDDLAVDYRDQFEQWAEGLPQNELGAWSLDRFWTLLRGSSHKISPRTKRFVDRWLQFATGSPSTLLGDNEARKLIEQREVQLKGPRSRFRNRRALEQWRGASGVGRFVYRWPNVSALLNDLHDGLRR